MWWLTDYLPKIIVGVAFAVIGAAGASRCWSKLLSLRGWRRVKGMRRPKRGVGIYLETTTAGCLAFVSFVIGVLVALATLFGPGPKQRAAYLDGLFHSPPAQVKSIKIRPNDSPYPQLVTREFVVTKKDAIRAICSALNGAEPTFVRNRTEYWSCTITLELENSAYGCEVGNTLYHGCVLDVYSDGDVGADYGEFLADSLPRAVEKAVAELKFGH